MMSSYASSRVVAQPVERRARNPQVAGSNPVPLGNAGTSFAGGCPGDKPDRVVGLAC